MELTSRKESSHFSVLCYCQVAAVPTSDFVAQEQNFLPEILLAGLFLVP